MNFATPKTPTWFILVAACLATASANAQELRWKFAVGDQFTVRQTQTSTLDTRVDKRQTNVATSVKLSANWKVTKVEDDSATIEQSIDAIKVVIDNPADNTKSVSIDTASESRPAKNSRDLLKQLKPLIGMVFELKMNDRGEVVSVTVPDATQQTLAAIPTDSWLKALLDPGKLQAQIQNTTLALPENDLKAGQSVEITPQTNPASAVAATLGKRKMTYDGSKDVDGQQVDVFTLSTFEKFDAAKATPPSDPQTAEQPDVGTFEWDGKLQFDRESGCCTACEQETTIKTSRSHREMEMSTTIVVNSNFTLQRK